MRSNKLGLYLVTYNRARFLEKTLAALADSPFASCRLTILDNCSTDDTPQVCAAFAGRFPDCRVVRHSRNVTGNGNYLHAVEMSDTEYVWVVCDDDTYDFSAAADVLRAVESGEFDVILFWSPLNRGYYRKGSTDLIGGALAGSSGGPLRGQASSARALTAAGVQLHTVMSFWPSCIFRAEYFDSDCLHSGYEVAADCFPVFPFINKVIRDNARVYYSERDMVVAMAGNYGLHYLRYLTGWLRACRTIPDRLERSAVMRQVFSGRGVLKSMARAVMSARIAGYEYVTMDFFSAFFLLSPLDRLRLVLVFPALLVPRFIWVWLEKIWLARRGY